MSPPVSAFQVENFDPAPDEELICSICRCVFSDPVECPCRHVFCKNCIYQWLSFNKNCPVCRKKTQQSSLQGVVPILKNMIMKLTIHCKNTDKGCMEKPTLELYENHLKICLFEIVECQNTNCKKRLIRKDMEKHEQDECTYRCVKCSECGLEILCTAVKKHSCLSDLKKAIKDKDKTEKHLQKQIADQQKEIKGLHEEIEKLKAKIERRRTNSVAYFSNTSDTSSEEDFDNGFGSALSSTDSSSTDSSSEPHHHDFAAQVALLFPPEDYALSSELDNTRAETTFNIASSSQEDIDISSIQVIDSSAQESSVLANSAVTDADVSAEMPIAVERNSHDANFSVTSGNASNTEEHISNSLSQISQSVDLEETCGIEIPRCSSSNESVTNSNQKCQGNQRRVLKRRIDADSDLSNSSDPLEISDDSLRSFTRSKERHVHNSRKACSDSESAGHNFLATSGKENGGKADHQGTSEGRMEECSTSHQRAIIIDDSSLSDGQLNISDETGGMSPCVFPSTTSQPCFLQNSLTSKANWLRGRVRENQLVSSVKKFINQRTRRRSFLDSSLLRSSRNSSNTEEHSSTAPRSRIPVPVGETSSRRRTDCAEAATQVTLKQSNVENGCSSAPELFPDRQLLSPTFTNRGFERTLSLLEKYSIESDPDYDPCRLDSEDNESDGEVSPPQSERVFQRILDSLNDERRASAIQSPAQNTSSDTSSEEFLSDSSYEVEVPITTYELLKKYCREDSDDDPDWVLPTESSPSNN